MNKKEPDTSVIQLESVEIRDFTVNTAEESVMDAVDRLSMDDKKILKKTWKIVGKNMKETGGRIFEMIFDQSPDTKTLFPFMKPQVHGGKSDKINMDIQFHGLRFMQIIQSAITYLDHIKDLEPVLDNLGRRHGRLIERTAFRTHHWATFIECTLYHFRLLIVQDSGFSSDVVKTDNAVILWRVVLKAIINRMKIGLAQDLKNRKAHRKMKRDDNGSDFEDEVNFAKPPEKSIQEIVKADNDDPSLVKYKQELLGSAAAAAAPIILRPENHERVIVTNISLISDGQVKRSMDLPGPADFVLAIKEGCSYNIRIQYYVQREIVSGLRYQHKIKRLGVSVEKETYMFGSFAPRHEVYEYTSPAEEAPSGLLHRGKYNVTSLVRDDDDHVYLKWNWILEITKEW